MYNWRLLLFAFFAVFQTIASFEERNLVDGRQQCCDHRFSRDTGSRNGNSPFKLLNKDHSIKLRQDLKGVRRDDFRNEQRTSLIHFSTDQFRNAQERHLIRENPDFRIHSSRATFRSEVRATRTRELKPDSERNFARENSYRSSRDRTSEGRNIRTSENAIKYRERENNQRETHRRIINDAAENRRIFTELRQGDFRGANDHYTQRSSSFQNIRSSLPERRSERNVIRGVSSTRDNSRKPHLQRSARSLDRSTQNIEEQMRISSESFRVADNERQIRSRHREVRNERERAVVRPTSRFHDREHLYRKTNVLRDSRVNNEIRNNDSNERRIVRDNADRIAPRVAVEFRRFDINVIPIRNSREQNDHRDTIKVVSRLVVSEDRRERVNTAMRMLNYRHENRLSENKRERNNRDMRLNENNREPRNERSSEMLRAARISSPGFINEARTVKSLSAAQRENTRVVNRIKQQERGDVNERVRTSTQELYTRTAHSRIISKSTSRNEDVERKVNVERRFRERVTAQVNRLSSRKTNARESATYSKGSRDDNRVSESRRLVEHRLKPASERNTHEMKEDIKVIGMNWQYLLYTVQAIYLCSVLLPMLMEKADTKKKTRIFDWGTPLQKLIKVD